MTAVYRGWRVPSVKTPFFPLPSPTFVAFLMEEDYIFAATVAICQQPGVIAEQKKNKKNTASNSREGSNANTKK